MLVFLFILVFLLILIFLLSASLGSIMCPASVRRGIHDLGNG